MNQKIILIMAIPLMLSPYLAHSVGYEHHHESETHPAYHQDQQPIAAQHGHPSTERNIQSHEQGQTHQQYTYHGQSYRYFHNGSYYNYVDHGTYYRYHVHGRYYNYLYKGTYYQTCRNVPSSRMHGHWTPPSMSCR